MVELSAGLALGNSPVTKANLLAITFLAGWSGTTGTAGVASTTSAFATVTGFIVRLSRFSHVVFL